MLPFPNFDRLAPDVSETPEISPLEPTAKRPAPRLLPLILWYLWIAATSCMVLLFEQQDFGYEVREIVRSSLLANLLLTPGWVALAIKPILPHLIPAILAYVFILFIPELRQESFTLLIFAIVAGIWSILRWGRVASIDLVNPLRTSGSQTPRLADQIQFSLRSLILLSAVVALGISLYLFFRESPSWDFYKVMFFIVVPSELLLFWGMLGRASWVYRIPWLLVAIHHWCLLRVVQRGFQTWDQIYNWEAFTQWISIPLSQIVALGLLRWAGYRVGLPKPRERALPVAAAIEPQSPWD